MVVHASSSTMVVTATEVTPEPAPEVIGLSVSQKATTPDEDAMDKSLKTEFGEGTSGAGATAASVGGKKRRGSLPLMFVSIAHLVLNMSIIGQSSLLGATHTAMLHQAGGGSRAESLMLVGAGVGAIGSNIFTGWWMDRWPSHYIFALSAFLSSANLFLLPHLSGLGPMIISNALIAQGSGVGDCSYGALIWTAHESGVTNVGTHTGLKNLGTCFGFVVVLLLALLTSTPLDYTTLAYIWSAFCAAAGVMILAIPSPVPPKQAGAARETPGVPRTIARRENLVVCAGGLIATIVVGVFSTAATLPADWIGAVASHRLLFLFGLSTSIGQLVMSPTMQKLPPAAAHVGLLVVSAAGCLLAAISFAVGSSTGEGPDHKLLFVSYSIIGTALLTNFAVLFFFMSSLVNMSGARSSIIGLGAAANPMFTAIAATLPPGPMWAGCSILLLAMAALVILLELLGPRLLKKEF